MSKEIVIEPKSPYDIIDIIERLSVTNSKILLKLSIEENSDNYKYLCTSDNIKNWKFTDENNNEPIVETNIPSNDIKPKVDDIELLASKLLLSKLVNDITITIIKVIDCFILLRTESNNINFIGSNSIFTERLIKIYKNNGVPDYHFNYSMVEYKIISNYYSSYRIPKTDVVDTNKIMIDLLTKIRNNWILFDRKKPRSREEIIKKLFK